MMDGHRRRRCDLHLHTQKLNIKPAASAKTPLFLPVFFMPHLLYFLGYSTTLQGKGKRRRFSGALFIPHAGGND